VHPAKASKDTNANVIVSLETSSSTFCTLESKRIRIDLRVQQM